ncbi:NADH-quinone oxidoreductase subunit N [Fodinicurvata halophila]
MGVLLSSVTGYTLAAYHRDWPLSVESGMKYFLVGAFANAILVVGVTLVFGMAGATGYGEIAANLPDLAPSPLLLLGLALVVIGVAFKLGAVPAHTWVPDIAEGAPAPAAAFLTVVPKIGAAIALFRLVELFPPEAFTIRPLIAILAVATMTLGNLAALWQDDMRRMLGWSSVSQSGYALMAVAVVGLSDSALSALLIFLVGYALSNLAAFAVIAHLRGRTTREDYKGLASARPFVAITLIVALLSLVGIPPLAGFFGKLTLFLATIDGGYAWLAVVALANTVISLFYYLRFVAPVCFAAGDAPIAVLGRWTVIAVAVSAAGVIGFGLAGEIIFAAVTQAQLYQ